MKKVGSRFWSSQIIEDKGDTDPDLVEKKKQHWLRRKNSLGSTPTKHCARLLICPGSLTLWGLFITDPILHSQKQRPAKHDTVLIKIQIGSGEQNYESGPPSPHTKNVADPTRNRIPVPYPAKILWSQVRILHPASWGGWFWETAIRIIKSSSVLLSTPR